MSEHWTKKLKTEHEALRHALREALQELKDIPAGRLAKAPQGAEGLSYRQCAEEVDRRARAASEAIVDRLWDRVGYFLPLETASEREARFEAFRAEGP